LTSRGDVWQVAARSRKASFTTHVAPASRAAGSETTEIVPRRRDVDLFARRRQLVALACVVALLHPALAGAGRRARAHRGARRSVVKRARPLPADHGTRGIVEEHVHVRRGDTLETLLAARGVGTWEAGPWLAAAAGVYDLRRIRPRHGLTLHFDAATHTLEGIEYEMDDRSLLVLARAGDEIRAERAPLPYFIEVKGAAGRIEHGLREDAVAAGVPARVVSELADIFGWDLDLDVDLRPGDAFRVLYENTWQAGAAKPEPGNVIGAEIRTRGRSVTAIFFEDEDGNGAYYAPGGDPVSREFLRYPVDFTEITSEFMLLRRHPILHRVRPHLGVDLAAPAGTPVRAIARGTVVDAGWARELGRSVRLAHAGALGTIYGHLSRLAAGIRPGTPVERGQVIGYVGSTGLSTGPHLHFGVDRDGEYVDPLTLTAAPAARLPETARRAFERVQFAVVRQLAVLPESEGPLTVSLSASAYRPE
jgi:murein DD-endopeptidase MepM/ murein hydrolase activator NlpD